jgi:hypothetical protein
MIGIVQPPQLSPAADWQTGFLQLLPSLQRYAHFALRGLAGEAQEDGVSEVIANCLCAYRRLSERDELQRAFASVLVRYAVAKYYRGRRLGTVQCSRDVYSTRARKEAGIEIRSLGAPGEQLGGWMECLTDNRRTPVPDQAHFRIEFPRWLRTQTRRNRQIAEQLSMGCSTAEVASRFKVSSGRISQIRRELYDSWRTFTADGPAVAVGRASHKYGIRVTHDQRWFKIGIATGTLNAAWEFGAVVTSLVATAFSLGK